MLGGRSADYGDDAGSNGAQLTRASPATRVRAAGAAPRAPRRSEAGSSPSAVEMSVTAEQDRAGLAARRCRPDRSAPSRSATGNGRPLDAATPVEVGRRVDGAVVAEEEHRDRVHLEVEVRRRPLGVAGVAHEADHLAGLDVRAVLRERRERREVRVVELRCPGGRGARAGCRRPCSSRREKSVPSATATSGWPSSPKMSSPWW